MSRHLKADAGEKAIYLRSWFKTKKGIEYKNRHREYMKEWRSRNADKMHNGQSRWYKAIRLETLTHYSGGTPHCACCDEKIIEFLTIDHIEGNGAEHRRQLAKQGIKLGGNALPYWLKKNGWPKGYQVLCANCNFGKRTHKECPHVKYRKAGQNLLNCFS